MDRTIMPSSININFLFWKKVKSLISMHFWVTTMKVAKNFPSLLPATKKCTIQLYSCTIQALQWYYSALQYAAHAALSPHFQLRTSITFVSWVRFQKFFPPQRYYLSAPTIKISEIHDLNWQRYKLPKND